MPRRKLFQRAEQSTRRIAHSIRIGGGQSGPDDKRNWDTYMIQGKIRRLTPRECERLMSWPDDWTRWGVVEKDEFEPCHECIACDEGFECERPIKNTVRKVVEISDSQRYKMCGNGVVSAVVKAVVENVIGKPAEQKE